YRAGAVGPADEDGARLVRSEQVKPRPGETTSYKVVWTHLNSAWCDCPDTQFRNGHEGWCKHGLAVWMQLRHEERVREACDLLRAVLGNSVESAGYVARLLHSVRRGDVGAAIAATIDLSVALDPQPGAAPLDTADWMRWDAQVNA